MPALKDFFAELKARKVRRTLAIYMSSALTAIGIVRLFTDVYKLPAWLFPLVVTLLTCGLVSAFLFAWYHGKEGWQSFGRKELLLHALVGIVAVYLSVRVASSPPTALQERFGKSIAVLPFTNLSGSKEDEYFSDGIMEDVLTQLSKISDLRVISRTSVMKYKKRDTLNIRAIGKELNVAAILEGSVQRYGNRVRITGQLINAVSDEHIWSESYDRAMDDVFAIQTEVAERIAAELKAHLSPQEAERIEKRPTTSLEAYAFYLRGRDYYNRYTKEDNERAIEMFKRAIALDSNYALAYAGLADAYSQRVQRFNFPETWADSSIALSERALELDADIAEPYKALGLAYSQRGWYRKAIREYEHALRRNPNFASVVYNLALVFFGIGRHDEAIPLLHKAIRLTPGRASYYLSLSEPFIALEEDSLAEYYLHRCLQLDPHDANAYANLIQLRFLTGRFAEARALAESACVQHPDAIYLLAMAGEAELFGGDYARAYRYFERWQQIVGKEKGPLTQMGYILLQQGQTAQARAMVVSAEKAAHSVLEIREDNAVAYDLARALALQGKVEEALSALTLAFERGWNFFRWTSRDRLLKALHGTAQFDQLLARMRTAIHTMRARRSALNLQDPMEALP